MKSTSPGIIAVICLLWTPLSLATSYTIASSNNFPPVNMVDANGHLSGFGRDMSSAVAKSMGFTVRYQHTSHWSQVLAWIDSGEADFIHDIAYSSERDLSLDFSNPIVEMPEVIIVKKGRNDISNIESLFGKKVACVNRHISHLYLKQFPLIRCHLVATPSQAMMDLVGGYVDALVYPKQIARYLAFQLHFEDKIQYVKKPLRTLSWSMAVKQGNRELLQKLNQGIENVVRSGEYQQIYNKWFEDRVLTGYSQQQVQSYFTAAILLILSTALLFFLWHWKKLKQANLKLQYSENKYRTLIEQLPIGVYFKDKQLRYQSGNKVFAEYLGVSLAKIIGHSDEQIAPPNQHNNAESDAEVMKQGKPLSYDQQKGPYWAQITKSPVRNVQGELEGLLGTIRDITQQKNYENAMAQQITMLETVFKHFPEPILLLNNDLQIVMSNPAAEQMFGSTKQQTLNLSLSELAVDKSLDWTELVRQSKAPKIQFKRQNGASFFAKLTWVQTQFSADYSYILVIKDISPQISTETYLRRLNRTLTTFLETRHSIIRSSTESTLLQSVCEILINTGGYRFVWVGLLNENSLKPLVHAGHQTDFLEALDLNVTRGDYIGPIGDAIRTENTCVCEDLHAQESAWNSLALQNGFASSVTLPMFINEELSGIVDIYADKPQAFDAEELSLLEELVDDVSFGISALKAKSQMDMAILQRASVMDSVADIVYQLDETGMLVLWNKQFRLVSGYTNEELQNKHALDFFDAEQKTVISQAIEKCFHTGYVEVESLFQIKDGTQIPYHFSGSLTKDEKDNIIGITGVGRDLQETKLAEQEKIHLQNQLQHAQKMESIGQLTGGIAHDFNNILASIMGYTTLVMDFITPDSNDKLNGYLQQVMKASERARDLVRQMLAFSRGSETELSLLSLQPLLNESVNMLQSTLASTIEIKQISHGDLPEIMADSVQLNQVILNLCINARDAMSSKGIIQIETNTTDLKDFECSSCHHVFSGNYVELSISDTGKGLDQNLLAKVFEPFFTTKEVGKGSGMGLAMVHGIVHKHNGHIVVESSAGQGTCFRLFLPLGEPDIEYEMISDINHRNHDSKHILVVDDEAPVALFEGELLKGVGYDVSVFTNSCEAFRRFEESPGDFDLVVTDQTMPELTGGEMATEMLKIRPDLPVVLCTGFSNALSPQQAADIGIKGYFHKPLNKDALLKKIRELVL